MNRIILLAVLLFIFSFSDSFSQVPELLDGWPYSRLLTSYAEQNIPRFACDADLAIFYSTPSGDNNKFHMNGSYYNGWPVYEDEVHIHGRITIVDLDHDGKDELVANGYFVSDIPARVLNKLYIIDDDGTIFPDFPIIYSTIICPNVADFDADGEYELIFYDDEVELIYCIDRFGNPEPGWPVDLPDDIYHQSVNGGAAVGDLDLDGFLEYIVKSNDCVYAFRYDGTMIEDFLIKTIEYPYFFEAHNAVTLGDVDFDGYLEIVLSAQRVTLDSIASYVAIYEHTGEPKEGWPIMFPDAYDWNMPTIADINSDGIPEIGFSMDVYTYFVDVDGNPLDGWPVEFYKPDGRPRMPMSDIIAVDVDGDNDCEIFFDFNTQYWDPENEDIYSCFYGSDHHGQDLPGYPVIVEGSSVGCPPIFHFDSSDNQYYMALSTLVGYPDSIYTIDSVYLEVFQFPDSTGPPDQWPMQGHDNLMTRNYNFVDRVTAIRDDEQPLPKSYILTQNYPNPFNAATTIDFALPKPEHVTITVYDILGRRVEVLVDETLPAGNHQALWQADDYASGMYFYRMEAGDLTLSRKMLLIK